MLIGYARVCPTDQQSLALQEDALRAAGCRKVYLEKESGRVGTKRPELEAALASPAAWRTQLVVWEDRPPRPGRCARCWRLQHMLQERGIKLRSLTEQVDTETATGG